MLPHDSDHRSERPADARLSADPLWGVLRELGEGAGAPSLPGDFQLAEFDKPARVLRYELREQLGFGGMGIVYRGYDPELHREVAIKLLRPWRTRHGDQLDKHSERMLREARAMAKLSHPNVVAVHDAGVFEGGVFIAMDLVKGPTLRAWLRERDRHWSEILEVFLEAGRGLAHAHSKHLVHRDFKPENVLINDHGAQVTDFGLVTDPGDGGEPEATMGPTERGEGRRSSLTGKSDFLGTDRYAAPEQRRSAAVDSRADQYSFCVALHEALYRCLPGDEAARRRGPPPAGDVPLALWQVLERGLHTEPGARWPTMNALLAALAEAGTVMPSEQRMNGRDAGATTEAALTRVAFWRRWSGHNRRTLAAASLVLLGSLTAVATRGRLGGTDSKCTIRATPEFYEYTPAFDRVTQCMCTPQTPDCHQLFRGRALAIHGLRATLEFKKTNGGPPSRSVRYWVLGGDVSPACHQLENYPDFADGYWPAHKDTLLVENVSIWPSQAEFDAAPPGSTRTLFLVTGDGAGNTHARTWYQRKAVVFTKVCGQ